MKIRTVLATATGIGIGYVLGARAGREKFDELKAQAQRIVSDPDVRQKVSDLPNTVMENLPKAQSAVSDAFKGATGKSSAGEESSSGAGTSAGTSTAPEGMLATDALADASLADASLSDASLSDASVGGDPTDTLASDFATSSTADFSTSPTADFSTSPTADLGGSTSDFGADFPATDPVPGDSLTPDLPTDDSVSYDSGTSDLAPEDPLVTESVIRPDPDVDQALGSDHASSLDDDAPKSQY